MSFKIFSFQLTGKIKPTATIEKQREQLAADYAAFVKTEASEELKAFLELEKTVTSPEFKSKQKEIEGLSYKGSKEEHELKEFEKLKGSSPIKRYFQVEGSADLARFDKERESEKMKRYYALSDYIKEGDFDKEKREIKSQVFKGSPEEKHFSEFKKLSKSKAIKAYFELNGSGALKKHDELEQSEKFKRYNELKNAPDNSKEAKAEFRRLKGDSEIKNWFRFERSTKLKLYKETRGSHDLSRYEELKSLVESKEFKEREAFLKDKGKFEKSEAFKKQQEFKRLSADDAVKFVLKYEKSKLYKNYLDVKDSFDLKRYNELKEIVNSEEFKKQKAWLEDKKRWEKTPRFRQYQEYLKENQQPGLVNYFKYKDSNAFDFFRNWEVVFQDDFSGKTLDAEKWSTCSEVAKKTLGRNYALPGDLAIFTDGANISTGNKLQIISRKEKAEGMVWNMPAGFVPVDFDHTSGMISANADFDFADAVLEAKVKFDPVKSLISSLYLTSADNTSRVNLLEMGKRNHLGFSVLNGNGKVESVGIDISNLKRGSYIFSLQKLGSKFSWKINETEIHQQENTSLSKASKLAASSLVVDPLVGSGAAFEVEWVKCYRKM